MAQFFKLSPEGMDHMEQEDDAIVEMWVNADSVVQMTQYKNGVTLVEMSSKQILTKRPLRDIVTQTVGRNEPDRTPIPDSIFKSMQDDEDKQKA